MSSVTSIASFLVPEEFQKVITDFINDIISTFPEYELIINKWWKLKDFSNIENEEERNTQINKNKEEIMTYIFNYCLTIFPDRFFEILYQNNNLFSSNNATNTEFLPGISFKYLMNSDISEKTRETIWKYLQLIMMTLASSVKNNSAFSETEKLFESLNGEEFKDKLEETMEKMQQIFQQPLEQPLGKVVPNPPEIGLANSDTGAGQGQLPDFSNLLDGKIGDLAREIAEETAGSMNIDGGLENITNSQDAMNAIFKNPGKLMELVSSVGNKLQNKIKSGDISEKELFSEATGIMNSMKDMPGMDNIETLLKQMGLNAKNIPNLNKNTKVDTNTNTNTNLITKQMENIKNLEKEKMKERHNKKKQQKQQQQEQQNKQPNPYALTDDELISMFESVKK